MYSAVVSRSPFFRLCSLLLAIRLYLHVPQRSLVPDATKL